MDIEAQKNVNGDRVKSMEAMFSVSKVFNQDLTGWNNLVGRNTANMFFTATKMSEANRADWMP